MLAANRSNAFKKTRYKRNRQEAHAIVGCDGQIVAREVTLKTAISTKCNGLNRRKKSKPRVANINPHNKWATTFEMWAYLLKMRENFLFQSFVYSNEEWLR